MKGTKLAFRTSPGGVSIPSGQTTNLTSEFKGGIIVKSYPKIRVILTNKNISTKPIKFKLIINQDGELIASLDEVTLQPGTSFTQTYDIPGTGLTINATSELGSGKNTVDVLVYGYIPYSIEEKPYCYY
ncbi:hypothetical protein [Clostridium sp.]|uniref:hypothetical protein n=1 Tax=Clostridium sp. TaxID=1506 RepID=UPI003F31BF7A